MKHCEGFGIDEERRLRIQNGEVFLVRQLWISQVLDSFKLSVHG